jgi:hypothetical protein
MINYIKWICRAWERVALVLLIAAMAGYVICEAVS